MEKPRNLEEIFLNIHHLFRRTRDLSGPNTWTESQTQLALSAHEHMAGAIAKMQREGASMEFVCTWVHPILLKCEHTIMQRGVMMIEIIEDFKAEIRHQPFNFFQQTYQPLIDKMQLERDIAPHPHNNLTEKTIHKI